MVLNLPHHLLFLFLLSKHSLLKYCFMILPLSFLLDSLLEFLSSTLKITTFMIVAVVKTSYDVGFRHQFLHFKRKVRLPWILYGVEFFDNFLCD